MEHFAYTVPQGVIVPVLDSDKKRYETRGEKLSTWGRRERRIVANLIDHLNAHGFICIAVDDGGDELEKVNDMREAMEAAFAVDDATLIFAFHTEITGTRRYEVNLIFGNGNDGLDVISDHSTGGLFGDAMDAFDVEVFA